jgi:hypothetical protein
VSVALFAFCLPLTAIAQDLKPIAWQELNPYEQEILAELKTDWDNLPAVRQHQLQRGAERWLRRMIRRQNFSGDRFRRLMELNPDERNDLRTNFDQFGELPDEEQSRIRDAQDRFQQLNEEERENIRRQYEAMSPQERRQFERERRLQRERQRETIRDN